jgi:uncharacterized protein (DUF2141 family)
LSNIPRVVVIGPRLLLAAAALMLLQGNSVGSTVEVQLTHLRSERGVVHVCLTRSADHFPDCAQDPEAVKATVRASEHDVRLPAVEPGQYALAVIHDENGNGRLDTMLGIPKEGFGFSRNPSIGFGPPPFEKVRFAVEAGATTQRVRLRYLL